MAKRDNRLVPSGIEAEHGAAWPFRTPLETVQLLAIPTGLVPAAVALSAS